MVFKRRDRRPTWKRIARAFWPKGGWGRAARYVQHRLNRLPDPPERIARGIFAGVFVTFTPFYGLHFFLAMGLAFVMRGNLVASLLGTFFGNPLTYVPIAATSLQAGYWMLGIRRDPAHPASLGDMFSHAFSELWWNFKSVFTSDVAQWDWLTRFYHEIIYPWMIGGIVPGIVAALVCYYVSVPLIRAYQNRRKGRLKERLVALKAHTKKSSERG